MTTIVLDSDSDSCDTVVAGTSGSPFVSSGKPSKTVKVEPTPGLNNGVVDLTEEEEEEEESEATDDSADEAPKTRPSAPQRNGGSTLQPTTMPPQGNQTPQNGTCDVSGETSEEEDEAPRGIKRSLEPSDSTPGAGGEPGNPSKKPALQEDDPSTDDSEDEGWRCASWKVQEEMVKRLKRHFPRKTTEELRVELVWHQWQFDKTLQALRLVAEEVSSSEEGPSNQDDEVPSTSSVSSPPADRPTTSTNTANPPPPHRHIPNGSTTNSSGRAGRPATSETDSWSLSGTNGQIFRFFQEATKDELCLMHRCSEKKAEKIIQLRPYKNWDSLLVALKQTSGLTVELLQGCRLVLKEQQVVHGLMKECEVISRTMMDHVTQVVESTRSHYKQQPPILNSECQMKSYQLIGLNWLHLLHENNVSGILADEMGLGKTVQAIAFLASLYEEGNTGPHLIIVPGSTLDNWVRELTLWCPSLKVFTYNGSVEERRSMHLQLLKEAGNYNIIISTYKMAVNNSNDRSLFRKLSLEYAVFDEGHVLKNMRSQRYRHLMDINAKYRLLLTGTPMQNNLLELMSLLNFIMPEMFSSSTTEMFKMFNVVTLAQNTAS